METNVTVVSTKIEGIEKYQSKMGKPMVDIIIKDDVTRYEKGAEVTHKRFAFQAADLKRQLCNLGGMIQKALLKKKMWEFTRDELDAILVKAPIEITLTLHTEGEVISSDNEDVEDYTVDRTFTSYEITKCDYESPLTSVIALGMDVNKESKNHPGFTILQSFMSARDGISISSAAAAFL